MFHDRVIFFCGGLSALRIGIFTKIWTSNGGIVNTPPKTSKKSSVIPFFENIDVILIENKNIAKEKLLKQLNCQEISTNTKVIHCSWLERCAQLKQCIDSTNFEIKFSDGGPEEHGINHSDTAKRDLDEAGIGVIEVEPIKKRSRRECVEESQPQGKGLSQKTGIMGADCERHEMRHHRSPAVISGGSRRFAGIIMRHGRSIFLVQPTGSSGYGFPKGEVSGDESLRDGALREFQEETGITLPAGALLEYIEESGTIHGNGQKTVHAFLYEGTGEEGYQGSNLIESGFRKGQPENCDGRYFEIEEAERIIHRNQRELLRIYAENYL